MKRTSIVRLTTAFGLGGLLTSVATGDLVGSVFSVTASTADGHVATWSAGADQGYWDGDTYVWESESPIELWDGSMLVGTLNPDGASGSGSVYVVDPQVNLNFSVQAGAADTQFTISSALLTFPTIDTPEARASAAFTVSDLNGNGVTLTGAGPNGGGYVAQYNGLVPGGTTFAELIPNVATATPFGTMTESDHEPAVGYTALGEPVSDMSVQVAFDLTAHDIASGTTTFVIVPEPGGLLMVAVGFLAVLRRR